MAMTYAQLVAAVVDYTQNTFETTTINTMIKQAEQRIYNTVQIANLRKNVTGVLATGNKYLACPEDFLSTYSLAIYPASGTGDYLYLLNKDVNFMRDAYPNPATTGKPKHYAIFGPQSANVNELSFILGPTPDANYNAELHYYYYPESIVTALTTWLGDNFDSALLYGTLSEAGAYMKSGPEDGMYAMYQERYVQAIALLKNLGDGKQRMDAYRDGQVRVPVA
jgi:hypothetical protein